MPTLSNLTNFPLSFEPNTGQTDPSVDFLARGSGYAIFLSPLEIVMVLCKPTVCSKRDCIFKKEPVPPSPPEQTVLRVKFNGANPAAVAEGMEGLPGRTHYFIGNDSSRWRSNIPTYSKIRYRDLYPGIDLVYYGAQGCLEYDFIVASGADPQNILLEFEGNGELNLDEAGHIQFQTDQGPIVLHKPRITQAIDGVQQEVEGGYRILDSNRIQISCASYDQKSPLVIDPVLAFSTYLGGGNFDESNGIAVDSTGNAYIIGFTYSTDFPTANAYQPSYQGNGDVFISKIKADGSALLFSTYLGGSDYDLGIGIALDPAGNIYITGYTESTDFPTVNPLQPSKNGYSDAFITKIKADGSALLFSSYFGGTSYDYGYGIAIDPTGNAYITGITYSTDFPTANAYQPSYQGNGDVFISKIKADGSTLIFSTYLGGSDFDSGFGIALDPAGNAYITGYTESTDFPTVNPLQPSKNGYSDVFITKIKADGSALIFSSYLGGANYEYGNGITLDPAGNAYITGYTGSSDFPTANPLQSSNNGNGDAFITKIKADGSALLFSTYLGGSDYDLGIGIALDPAGNIYITGYTYSDNFPTANAYQSSKLGHADAFITRIKADGSALLFSSYFGGTSYDYGFGIAIDPTGRAFFTGVTESTDFPTINPLQPTNHGLDDAFIVKINAIRISLTMTKSVSSNPALVGNKLTYRIRIANTGVDSATGVTLIDTLPATVTFVSANLSQGSCSLTGNVLTCQLGNLGASATATLEAVVIPTTPGTITNRTVLTADETAPREVSVDTTVLPGVKLKVNKSSDPNPIRVGDNLTYSITVFNQGPSTASEVILVDSLPNETELVSVHVGRKHYPASCGVVTLSLGSLSSNESTTVSIVTIPRASGVMTNTATVTCNETGPQTIHEITTVLPAPFDSGLFQIAVGKIREFVPPGRFKRDLLQMMSQVNKLLEQGRFLEAHTLTLLVLQKLIRLQLTPKGPQLKLHIIIADMRIFIQSLALNIHNETRKNIF